jgi:hypothetical protein
MEACINAINNSNKFKVKIKKKKTKENNNKKKFKLLIINVKYVISKCNNICPAKILANNLIAKLKILIKYEIVSIKNKGAVIKKGIAPGKKLLNHNSFLIVNP